MKITIELTEAEVKGLKDYLKEVCDIKPTKKNILIECSSLLSATLSSGSVGDYISKHVDYKTFN